MLLNYKKFMESKTYELGCVFIDFNISNWQDILDSIDKTDLYEKVGEPYGLQERPHLSLLYGLHSNVSDSDVLECFNGFNKDDFKIEIDCISFFENKDYDVIKFDIKSNENLIKINKKLALLPNTNIYPYSPHITIAYLKRGLGKKYKDINYSYKITNIDKVVYTKAKANINKELLIFK